MVPSLKGLKIADVGCGYNASFVRSVLADVGRATAVDVALADDLKQNGKVQAIQGALPDALKAIPDGTLDFVLCNNVIEHLWEPLATLREVHRIVAPNGCAFVNVPSWRGKWFLEFSAFRLGTSPASEMNDHKMYYDPRTDGHCWCGLDSSRRTFASAPISSASTAMRSVVFSRITI